MEPFYCMAGKKDSQFFSSGTFLAGDNLWKCLAVYSEILKQSYWAEENTLSDVFRETQRVAELLFRDEAMQEFVGLIHKALRL